jgi:hypothetical protein
MAGLRPGHPRLSCLDAAKTWMPGKSPGMTSCASPNDTSHRCENREGSHALDIATKTELPEGNDRAATRH